MNKFIKKIISFSLKNKLFIFFSTLILIIWGILAFKNIPIEAFPDVTNTQITIITQWPGRSAEEVEKYVTIPVELAMNPVQKRTSVRSTTVFGLSVIKVIFEDDVDDAFARQQVNTCCATLHCRKVPILMFSRQPALQARYSVIPYKAPPNRPAN